MRDKWVLKHSLTDLRSSLGLSMEALAERAYTTNTTIFRIEKTGIIADPALAKTLASVFGLPVEDFCSVDFASDRMKTEWSRQIERPYSTTPDPEAWYYLVFVRRYEKFGEYSAISPTSWVRNENGKERRRLMVFGSDGIIEHLAEYKVKCAVVHDSLALIYFYYGIPDNEERAVLVRTDVADSVYPRLVKEYLCDMNSLPNHYDFKDLAELELHGAPFPPAEDKGG